ncbi:MAG: DUF445 domain-containing protein [Leptospiraceae bacterium]|jgi:uncharacterized membrane protein YheB (UPF0754 family)|nr:DUF445 domain-containing protein [Leptospiraceae bacterium]MBK7055525.1 DUF445 domain-containing protein [Leptospiraceae bacterium]MBK9502335.1 DUF445 domain-containing protein [Leptospiraceae bacterium]MBL0263061.1 DUF445 domain-containing protein [Leptospiraceae bacterium]MBP9162294.1 DUF445 domain-containing protein [Leptospiraceae bacterium]
MWEDFQQHLWLYLSMPLVAALIGYVTKLVAIRMMFQPIKFIGIKPFLGWQGIIPRRAEKMASIAADTLTARLINTRELYNRIDPTEIIKALEEPLIRDIDIIADEVIGKLQPEIWEALPTLVRDQLIGNMRKEIPGVIKALMADMDRDLDSIFDIKSMVVSIMSKDKELLNRIFKEVGKPEFQFIANSGIYFGFLIGLIQASTWMLTHSPLIMPMFGLFTGWFTDWLALKMIFYPKQQTKYMGLVTWQGLFIKRRQQVAAEYGALIATEILTPRNILEYVLSGPLSDRLYEMITRIIKKTIDTQVGFAKPIVIMTLGGEKYQEVKHKAALKIIERLPETLKNIETYVGNALDIKNTIVSKMQQLTEEEFEGVLRPAFQQDEWILITVGAVLGFLVGEMQVFLMTH